MDKLIPVQAGLSALIATVLVLTLAKTVKRPDRPGAGFGLIFILALIKLGLHLYSNHYYSLTQLLPYTTMVVILVAFLQQVLNLRFSGRAIEAGQTPGRPVTPFVTGGFILVLMIMGLLKDPKVHESFMMTHPSAILFFVSRPLSLGLAMISFAWSMETLRLLRKGRDLPGERARDAARAGRLAHDFLVSAQMAFLAGEIAGSLWSFLGWGTTWRWSRTFFFSAMIFVLFLISVHTPYRMIRHPGRRQGVAALPVLLVIVMLLSSKLG